VAVDDKNFDVKNDLEVDETCIRTWEFV